MKTYEEEVERLQNISALQYNLIRTQDVSRICELVSEYIFQTYQPDTFVILVFNHELNDYDYRNVLFTRPEQKNIRETILSLPIWKDYFISKTEIFTPMESWMMFPNYPK